MSGSACTTCWDDDAGKETIPTKPAERSRQQIDALLTQAGWVVQEFDRFNLRAARGIAIAEFPLSTGPTDYLLVVDRQAVGLIEAMKVGETLTGVEVQSTKYREGCPAWWAPGRPVPAAFCLQDNRRRQPLH